MPAREQPRYWMQAIAAGVALVMIAALGTPDGVHRRTCASGRNDPAGEVPNCGRKSSRLQASYRTPAPTAVPLWSRQSSWLQ